MLELNRVYLSDCLNFLEKVGGNNVDLAIVDPPYNLKKAKWDTFNSDQAFLSFTYAWIDALLPTLKKSGSVYIFNTPRNAAYILKYLDNKGLYFQNWITWDKRDGFSATKKKFVPTQETILFYSKSKNPYFDADSIREPYRSTERIAHATKKGILKNGKRWFPDPRGRLSNDVWHIVSERHKNKMSGKVIKGSHATPKPIEMIERMVLASSKKGDIILDCFVGSGTTAVAAQKLGRNFLVADYLKSNVELTRKRLKDMRKT